MAGARLRVQARRTRGDASPAQRGATTRASTSTIFTRGRRRRRAARGRAPRDCDELDAQARARPSAPAAARAPRAPSRRPRTGGGKRESGEWRVRARARERTGGRAPRVSKLVASAATPLPGAHGGDARRPLACLQAPRRAPRGQRRAGLRRRPLLALPSRSAPGRGGRVVRRAARGARAAAGADGRALARASTRRTLAAHALGLAQHGGAYHSPSTSTIFARRRVAAVLRKAEGVPRDCDERAGARPPSPWPPARPALLS